MHSMETTETRFIDLIIKNTFDKKTIQTKALIDSGASVSCLPENIIEQLGLIQTGLINVRTASGVLLNNMSSI